MTTGALSAASAAAFVAAGLAFGWAYFGMLRRTVGHYAAGGRVVPAALTLARVAGALLFLGFAVQFGALTLLAAFGGFLGARALASRSARRAA